MLVEAHWKIFHSGKGVAVAEDIKPDDDSEANILERLRDHSIQNIEQDTRFIQIVLILWASRILRQLNRAVLISCLVI